VLAKRLGRNHELAAALWDVRWALRVVGRRNAALNTAALTVAQRLSVSSEAAARWVGRGALKELASPLVVRQLAARRRRTQG
jgi:hypothetical protein